MIGYRVLGLAAAAILVGSLGALTGCSSDEAKADAPLTAKQVQAASVTLTVHDSNGAVIGDGAGILIAPRVVLTSAHLVSGKARWSVTSADGKTKVNGIRGLAYDWMNYDLDLTGEGVGKAHPRKHDVAVIYLDAPIRLDAYPKVATEKLAQNAAGNRLRSNGAAFQSIPATFTKVKGFPHAYLTDISKTERVEAGNAVLNDRNEIVGLVTGRGTTTGKLYVARTNDIAGWIAPKSVCGGAASTATYAPPTKKAGCDDTNNGTSGTGGTSGGSSGTSGGSSSGGSSGTSGGSSGTSGGSSGTSGTSGGSSGTDTSQSSSSGSSGETDNKSCTDGGGICSGDCSSLPNNSSSSGGSSGTYTSQSSGSSGSSGETGSGSSGTSGGSSGSSGESGSGSSSGGASSGMYPSASSSSGSSGESGSSGASGSSGTSGSSGETASGSSGTSGSSGSNPTESSSGTSGSSGSSGETASGSSGTSGGSTTGSQTSSGSSGGENDEEVCSGPSDNPETCPTESDGCSGPKCGGAKVPDPNIAYSAGGCPKCNSGSSSDTYEIK